MTNIMEFNMDGGTKCAPSHLNSEKNNQDPKRVNGTQEWAAYEFNFVKGCPHDCHYCYAKGMAIRFGRVTSSTWRNEQIDWGKINKNYTKWKKGRIMTPTSHDITPGNIHAAEIVYEKLLRASNELLIVSKPSLFCIKRLCSRLSNYKSQFTFRFSIGSIDDSVLKTWEPKAPNFNHRLKCLKYAFENGFKTSVSCEPILDKNTRELVVTVLPYVTDTIWIGLPSNLKSYSKMNSGTDVELLKLTKDLKNDLNEN